MRYQIILALVLSFFVTISASLQSQQVQNYEITQITEDLYRAANNTHRTVFLVTEEGIILADPVNVEFAAWLRSELDERFDVPVKYVLYSHSHADHASGGAAFADTALFVGHEKMEAGVAALGPAAASDILLPDMTFADQMAVRLGGQTVELHYTGPAHSDDMTVLLFKEQRVGFGVDYANIRRLPGRLNGYHFDQYAHALGVFLTLDIDTVVIGHGDIVGTRQDLDDYLGFLRELQAQVTAAIEEGLTLEETQQSVLLMDYSQWQSFADRRATLVGDAYSLLTEYP